MDGLQSPRTLVRTFAGLLQALEQGCQLWMWGN